MIPDQRGRDQFGRPALAPAAASNVPRTAAAIMRSVWPPRTRPNLPHLDTLRKVTGRVRRSPPDGQMPGGRALAGCALY
jgi:hypothetical protein